jgi:MFS family permease
MLSNLIISDIVPLRERGTFQALLQVAVLMGTASGPFAGGIIVQHSWRWVFLLNLPIGGLALLLVVAFLKVNYNKESTIKEKFKRVDYIGNAIFVASVVAILISLTWGGTTYPWSSSKVILPLIFGFLGLGGFVCYESSKYCLEPTMPPNLFKYRNTAAAFTLTFLYSLTLYWLVYYLPLYFQAVQLSTPSRSGIQLMPTVIIWVPFAQLSGRLVARFGRYRPLHHIGFALATLGMGLLTLLRRDSCTGQWAGFQAIIAAGLGLTSTTLPAVLAALDEKDVATATGTWAFLRSFGIIWGVTLPAAVFNNQFNHFSSQISDPVVRGLLRDGHAYEHGTKEFIEMFEGMLREVCGRLRRELRDWRS